MKQLRKLFAATVVLLTIGNLCGCRSNSPEYEGKNTLTLSNLISGVDSQKGDLTPGVKSETSISVISTVPSRSGSIVKLEPQDPTVASLLQISPEQLILTGDQNKDIFKVKFKDEAPKVSQELKLSFNLSVIKASEKTFWDGKQFVLVINPSVVTVDLTPEQKKLLEYYKSQYGMDLYSILGPWEFNGTVKTPGGSEVHNFVHPQEYKIDRQVVTLTLSPLATKERPILAMPENAFGLSDAFGSVYQNLTIKDREYWNVDPEENISEERKKLLALSKWSLQSPETYNVGYLTMELDPNTKQIKTPVTKSITEIVSLPVQRDALKMVYTEDDKYAFPFIFTFSPFERMLDHISQPDVKDWIIQTSVIPYQILFYSDTRTDGWKDDADGKPTHFTETKLSMDVHKGEIELTTIFDNEYETGYSVVQVTGKKL